MEDVVNNRQTSCTGIHQSMYQQYSIHSSFLQVNDFIDKCDAGDTLHLTTGTGGPVCLLHQGFI